MGEAEPRRPSLHWLIGRRGKDRGRRGLVVSLFVAGVLLVAGGTITGVALASQQHAPQPGPALAGTIGPALPGPGGSPTTKDRDFPSTTTGRQPSSGGASGELAASPPVSVAIPAIGVSSQLLHLGLNPDGTIAVPPLTAKPSQAAWFTGSPTPGQNGSSVIEGHVDSYQGTAVFFRLGDLRPGDTVDVTLADGTVGVFRVTGVRQYAKDDFPTLTVYEDTTYPSLRLITCGGDFDHHTGHYLSNTVVFASLTSSHQQS